ncbi:MAG: hypothetical protein WCR36_07670 [Bacteroidaceae bacterium]
MIQKRYFILCLLFLTALSTFTITAQETLGESKDYLKLGGAFRYTFMRNSWDTSQKKKGGQFIFDTMILSAKGELSGIEFAIESRYYAESSGGFMLHNGYVGFPLTQNLKLKIGMPRTPFGLMPYTGHNFMFNMPYYVGFEDDADFGLLLEYTKGDWEAQFNFAKNSEDVFSDKNKRYAYDLSGDNEEINQLTGRVAYHFGSKKQNEVGLTLQGGQIFNTITEEIGYKYALALHGSWQIKQWDIKAQTIMYRFGAKEPTDRDVITMGAFAADYDVDTRGLLHCLSIGYLIPINHRLLNDIKIYNDVSMLQKTITGRHDSYMNSLGCQLHTGPVYVLVDFVLAKNQPWIGTDYKNALTTGNQKGWNNRLNINLGVYF